MTEPTHPAEESEDLQTIYIVDDVAGMRDSLGELLKAWGYGFQALSSGEALLQTLSPETAGCVLLDYSMPGLNGLKTLEALREAGIPLPVVMITAHGDVGLAVEAMKAGAFDFIEKPWTRDTLKAAILRALDRDRTQRSAERQRQQAEAVLDTLTPREQDVFQELITGATNKVIARRLDISPRTVEFYRANVLEKAGVEGVAGLVRLAFMARRLEA